MGNNESNEKSQSNKDMATEGNLNIYIVHDNSIDEPCVKHPAAIITWSV